jgi:hypothetical protein
MRSHILLATPYVTRWLLPALAGAAGLLVPAIASAQLSQSQVQALSQLEPRGSGGAESSDGTIDITETEISQGVVQISGQAFAYCHKLDLAWSINGAPWSSQVPDNLPGDDCSFAYTIPLTVPDNAVVEVHAQVCAASPDNACGGWATTYINTQPNPLTFSNVQLNVGGNTGWCMDAAGGSSKLANGQKIDIWPCGNDQSNQQWTLNSSGQIKSNMSPNFCLDLPDWDVANGTQLDLFTCNGGTNQQWSYESDGSIVGFGGGRVNLSGGLDFTAGDPIIYWYSSGASTPNEVWTTEGAN